MNSKGITMYSLFDGSTIIDSQQMHTNYIYTFIVTKDGKKVITGSKDKKIKVWDWVKQKLIHTLLLHDETVESLVAT
jgi:WD40 repeat protein